jgi:hypothetical protein
MVATGCVLPAILTAPIAAIRHVIPDLAGDKDPVRHLGGFNTLETFLASL